MTGAHDVTLAGTGHRRVPVMSEGVGCRAAVRALGVAQPVSAVRPWNDPKQYLRFAIRRQGWIPPEPRVYVGFLRDQRAEQTGHWPGPARSYRILARMSCSASDAAAGSPDPPTASQVAGENWYLPR